jgi:hypothetical protein
VVDEDPLAPKLLQFALDLRQLRSLDMSGNDVDAEVARTTISQMLKAGLFLRLTMFNGESVSPALSRRERDVLLHRLTESLKELTEPKFIFTESNSGVCKHCARRPDEHFGDARACYWSVWTPGVDGICQSCRLLKADEHFTSRGYCLDVRRRTALENAKLQGAFRYQLEERDETTGLTPLLIASDMGDLDRVQVLLAAGANITAQDSIGRTATLIAASKDNQCVLRALLAAGARIDVVSRRGLNLMQVVVMPRPFAIAIVTGRSAR